MQYKYLDLKEYPHLLDEYYSVEHLSLWYVVQHMQDFIDEHPGYELDGVYALPNVIIFMLTQENWLSMIDSGHTTQDARVFGQPLYVLPERRDPAYMYPVQPMDYYKTGTISFTLRNPKDNKGMSFSFTGPVVHLPRP